MKLKTVFHYLKVSCLLSFLIRHCSFLFLVWLGYTVDGSAQEFHRLNGMLNDDQGHAMDDIKRMIDAEITEMKNGKCVFVDGPGGSGKTFLYTCVTHYAFSKNKRVCCMAWSGIAAQLLINGRTVHNCCRLPLHCERGEVACKVGPDTVVGKELATYDVFILDEASMVPKYAFDAIDKLLRELHDPTQPFGGVVMLLGGDFRQIPPVLRGGDLTEQWAINIRQASSWKYFKVYSLRVNMRLNQEPDSGAHEEWLLKVGDGRLNKNGELDLPDDIDYEDDNIADFIYPAGFDFSNSDAVAQRAILCPKNNTSLAMNEEILKRLPGKSELYLSADEINEEDVEEEERTAEEEDPTLIYPTEWLNEQTPSGMPPHKLQLKVGAIVMLLRNLHVSNGLCNGTRMIVEDFSEHSITCRLISGSRTGELVVLCRMDLLSDPESELPVCLRRRQFPIRLAFSMTINKSQGQTLDKVGVLLKTPCFAHGQLYVAVSRCRNRQGLAVVAFDEEGKRIKTATNVVIKQFLLKPPG
jgi:hypothetical protein